ncbi:DUF3796 domain-containing protein [Oceanobacillus piezotolerans]|uniref:DUF3796 domain-containing protein n=1 Tax=Oceanobacillus piezotolerans TaxID=2448030 RepID=UPI00131424F9|nr:DUF3796 domain-containing protein [Oceanobacillus piezotolerans]
MSDTLFALSGLIGGVSIAFIARYFSYRVGKKKHLFDERYKSIHHQAKARTYDVTFILLLIAWALVIVVEGISFSFFLITVLYVIVNITYAISAAYYSNRE